MAIVSSLDIATTALLAAEKAIDVTSHNISNVNTPGYSRQMPVLELNTPVLRGGLFLGTGVNVQSVQRAYDAFQAAQLMNARSYLSNYQTNNDILKTLEAAVNDLNGSSGISDALNGFFTAMQNVANSPSTTPERSTLLSNASVLATRFNNVDSAINTRLSDLNNELQTQVGQINSLSAQVANLNVQISAAEAGGANANDLRDERDNILTSIAKMINVSVSEDNSGQVTVLTGNGATLVSGDKSSPLSVAINNDNPAVYNIVDNGTALNDKITGGSIRGILDGALYYQSFDDKLNTAAAALIQSVDLQHRQGYGLDGSTGLDFFTLPSVYTGTGGYNTGNAQISAASITNLQAVTLNKYEIRFSNSTAYTIVNTDNNTVVTAGAYSSGVPITGIPGISVTINNTPASGDVFRVSFMGNTARQMAVAITDPGQVAAASSQAGLPGDNQNALLLSGIKDASIVDGNTIGAYYTGLITDVGDKSNEASNNLSAQQTVTNQLQAQRDSTSGVSMEEEAVNLIKYQRAYQAASKVISVTNQMLDTLLNMV